MKTLITKTSDLLPRIYNDLFDSLSSLQDTFSKDVCYKHFIPSVDIAEDDKSYYLHLSLSGVKKEDVKLEVEDGNLIISGERKLQKNESGKRYHKTESCYGKFTRSFCLPDNVNTQNIEAVYENGILDVVIQKSEVKLNKTSIEIK